MTLWNARRWWGLALGLLVATPCERAAQEMRAAPRTRQVELWGGLAQNSPRWGILGDTPAMDLALLGIRIERPLGGPVFVGATRSTVVHMDLIPLALLSSPYERLDRSGPSVCDEEGACTEPRGGAGPFASGAVVGMGISPLGITTRFRHRRRVSPSVGVTGGALLFDRAVPTRRSSFFNFTASVELGLRIGRPERAGVALTYRFHHLSNAGLAADNPAVASHILSFGRVSPARTLAARRATR